MPIAKVENLNVTLPLNFVCLNAEKSINAEYFKWIPEDNLPAEMVFFSEKFLILKYLSANIFANKSLRTK